MIRQSKLSCCGKILRDEMARKIDKVCPFCGAENPSSEEVDKHDTVFFDVGEKKSKCPEPVKGEHRKTLFIDIDGTMFKHQGTFSDIALKTPQLMPGVRDKMNEWCSNECTIILTTARRESLRAKTEKQLNDLGVPYDHLVMGIGKGKRIIINDRRPNGDDTAASVNIKRNEGFENIEI
tara:strand:+ start:9615 stop:10151 length:537 start_codon:yes stop_codon:yes gene_type:complete